MNRREFLKGLFTVAALAPITRLTGADKDAARVKGGKVTRRKLKNSNITLPMLGFGMMRLPCLPNGKVDYTASGKMFDRAMEAGVNYFDTAYFYLGGKSEKCAGDLLSKYPRSSYMLASKMPVRSVKKESDVERIWNEQLKKCKTSYFDFYLLHNLNGRNWKDVKRLHIYEFLKKKQDEGKIKKLGFSFHDSPNALVEIADAHKWDFAQIQLNYLDWTMYKSKEQYEILTQRGIPVIVMEPLRGGALASLNAEADAIFKQANPNASIASWAFRYVGSLPNVVMMLSGMNRIEHLEDNIATFTDFKPLSDNEQSVIEKALVAYHKIKAVPCTSCRYCMPCPAGVQIPQIFEMYNRAKASGNMERFRNAYSRLDADSKASACVKCNACVKKCPQKIDIPAMLAKIHSEAVKK